MGSAEAFVLPEAHPWKITKRHKTPTQNNLLPANTASLSSGDLVVRIVDSLSIQKHFIFGCRIVPTDRLPRIAIVLDVLRQNPGTHQDIHTVIVQQKLFRNSVLAQLRQPRGIDLHDAEITSAVVVDMNSMWVASGFDMDNRLN
jgi:hypothetical protein